MEFVQNIWHQVLWKTWDSDDDGDGDSGWEILLIISLLRSLFPQGQIWSGVGGGR